MNTLELTPKFTRMSRADRLQQLYDIIGRAGAPLTATQVARRAGIRKSTHLLQMLSELGADGDIFVIEHHSRRHLKTLFYAWHDLSENGADTHEQMLAWSTMLPDDTYWWNGEAWSNIEDVLPF